MMRKLVDYIHLHAERCPDKVAVVCGPQQVTYAQLSTLVHQCVLGDGSPDPSSSGDCDQENPPHYPVCLRATSTVDFLVHYFALHEAGGVAAPLEKDMPEDTFRQIAEELGRHECPEGTADVLYTTGTTGRSKGVMISHRTILADAENLIDAMSFTPDTVFVINGPLNHIGSLSKVYPVILLGGTIILIDGLRDLNAFFDAFRDAHLPSSIIPHTSKYATFLVPASIRILLQLAPDRIAALADRLDFIETGAAAISQSDMEKLCSLLPHTRLYNTYASTETGIIATYNFHDPQHSCLAGCLGRPMRHSRLFITPEGLIACQGPTLMTGYIGDPERTAAILHDDTLFTNDLGHIDQDGFLHLQGREDDVINVGGFKVAPTEVEDAALSFPEVKDCVCIPVDHIITGKALKLLVVMKEGKGLNRKALALHLKSKLEPYKIPMLYSEVEKVERTFNGKINRKYYTDAVPVAKC